MNKTMFVCFLSGCLFWSGHLFAEKIEPKNLSRRLTRVVRYHNDGTIKSIRETYPDNKTVKKTYRSSGEIKERINSDGSKVLFEFSTEDGHTVVTETMEPEGVTVKRILDKKGIVTVSIFPDRKEEYSYEYDNVGDITKVIVIREDGSREELLPDNNRLSFLRDYGIMEDDDLNMIKDMNTKKYLQNPTKYREEIMGHRARRLNPNIR